jgi:hypothetical protein
VRRRRLYRFGPHELAAEPGRLVIALARDSSSWDVVLYWPRFEGDAIGSRLAITKPVLLDALRILFAEADAPFDADALVAWIRRQTWGAPLPRLEPRREPVPMPQDERLAAEHGWSPE